MKTKLIIGAIAAVVLGLFGVTAAGATESGGSATITASATCEGVVSGTISWTGSETESVSVVRLFSGLDGSSSFDQKVIPTDGSVPGSVDYSVSGYSPNDVVRVTVAVTLTDGVDEREYNDSRTTTVPECPPATKTIDAQSIDQQCPDNGIEKQAHFVITQIGKDAPSSIMVSFTGGSSVNAPLNDVTGGTAHYYAPVPSGALVQAAQADVPYSWNGQFNLSHYVCEAPPPPSSSSTTSSTTTTSTTTTTAPPSSSTSSTTSTAAPPSSSSPTIPGGTLPSTGGGDSSGRFGIGGVLLLLAGGGLIAAARRRPAS